jgi:hypothetical protein
MEPVTTVATATSILSNAMNAMKVLRERAQSSKDRELKDEISDLYDTLLSLREAVMRVAEENKELKLRIAELEHPAEVEPELRQIGAVNYYFVGEKGPYCQPCYDGQGKLTMLTPSERWNGGVRRQCTLCKEFFYEQAMDLRQKQIRIQRG